MNSVDKDPLSNTIVLSAVFIKVKPYPLLLSLDTP